MGAGFRAGTALLRCVSAATLPLSLKATADGGSSAAASSATTTHDADVIIKPMRGWFGVYAGDDFYPSVFNQSANETVWDTYHFGRSTLVNAPSGSTGPVDGWKKPYSWHPAGATDGRMTLKQNIQSHCARSNSIYGVTTCGAVNNANDTNIWEPLEDGGMIQIARRWSLLSQHGCPQVAGMILDDFLRNYIGHTSDPKAPANVTGCLSCPPGRTGVGNIPDGFFCRSSSKVDPHKNHDTVCCLAPGTIEGCQSWSAATDRCYQDPAKQDGTPCLAPGFDSKSVPTTVTLDVLRDIKAALHGKTVDAVTGKVDHSSPSLTPHMKLFATIYSGELSNPYYQAKIFSDKTGFMEILDGATLWLDSEAMNTGPLYVAGAKNWTTHIAQLRDTFGPNFNVTAGNYLRLSGGPCIDYCPPAAFKAILENSVELYDAGEIVGMDVFSGIWLARIPSISPKMNATQWQVPTMFKELVWPWLGEATGTITDAAGKPVAGALVVVTYGAATPVTRKLTASDGTISFGGWSGKAKPIPHRVTVSAVGHAGVETTVQLVGQTTISFKISLGIAC